MNKRRGFTLAETLITLVVAGMSMLVLSKLISSTLSSTKQVGSLSDFNEAYNMVTLVMNGDPTKCGQSLANDDGTPVRFGDGTNPPATFPVPIQRIRVQTTFGTGTTDLFYPDYVGPDGVANPIGIPKGWTGSLTITGGAVVAASLYRVTIRLKMQRQKDDSYGASMRYKDLQAQIQVDGTGKIIQCSLTGLLPASPGSIGGVCYYDSAGNLITLGSYPPTNCAGYVSGGTGKGNGQKCFALGFSLFDAPAGATCQTGYTLYPSFGRYDWQHCSNTSTVCQTGEGTDPNKVPNTDLATGGIIYCWIWPGAMCVKN